MKLADFDFKLPEHLIAQVPAPRRDASRMMVVRRETKQREHHHFRDLPDILGAEHFLVINNTRVIPARLRACRPGKTEEIEILLLRELGNGNWLALAKPAKKVQPGCRLKIGELSAMVTEARESGVRVLQFDQKNELHAVLEKIGEPPLPPYIRRSRGDDFSKDRERYQTIYARHGGSVAAPTAGLHFTEDVFQRLKARGIDICEILLHVGYGTFQPVRCEEIEHHRMESEFFQVDAHNAARIKRLKADGRRLIAVGTTSTRCLEYIARQENALEQPVSGYCDLFIYPGFEFRMLDGLLTNFHLPKSTLFMLVCAFAGRELMLESYREAVAEGYRFYSYGDCMLIL